MVWGQCGFQERCAHHCFVYEEHFYHPSLPHLSSLLLGLTNISNRALRQTHSESSYLTIPDPSPTPRSTAESCHLMAMEGVYTVIGISSALAVVSLFARLYARMILARKAGWDDALVTVALLLAVGLNVSAVVCRWKSNRSVHIKPVYQSHQSSCYMRLPSISLSLALRSVFFSTAGVPFITFAFWRLCNCMLVDGGHADPLFTSYRCGKLFQSKP